MKKSLMPLILIALFLYSLSRWTGVMTENPLSYNLLAAGNFISLLCLILASLYGMIVMKNGTKKVSEEEEDMWRISLERHSCNAVLWTQAAFTVSFVTLIIGFMLVRDSHPIIALYALGLFAASFLGFMFTRYLTRYANPEFVFPDPNSPDYHEEVFNRFDDGEKHLMLKGLYRLYKWIIMLLVLLGFGLMFYSILSGKSQLISIIGIGCILLFVQTYFTLSLKPKKESF